MLDWCSAWPRNLTWSEKVHCLSLEHCILHYKVCVTTTKLMLVGVFLELLEQGDELNYTASEGFNRGANAGWWWNYALKWSWNDNYVLMESNFLSVPSYVCHRALGWTCSGSAYCQLIQDPNKLKRLSWWTRIITLTMWFGQMRQVCNWRTIVDFATGNVDKSHV